MSTRRTQFGRSAGLCLASAALLHLAGCRPEDPTDRSGDKVRAFVTILPQAYFVERIGGEHVAVEVMVGPGQSYHSYEPTPRQIAHLAEAQVYFTIGIPFERTLVEKIRSTNARLSIVDTRDGIELRHADHHCEGDAHDHDHTADGAMDPHIWLDPKLVKAQARTIAAALARLDPAHAREFDANCKAFQADLEAADRRIAGALAPYRGQEFFVFHPSFGYFGDAYGLKQLAVEESGKEPGGRELARLIEQARSSGVRSIFVQPQFARNCAQTVATEIGGRVVAIDPLSRDYLSNLEDMAAKLAESFRAARDKSTDRVTQAQP